MSGSKATELDQERIRGCLADLEHFLMVMARHARDRTPREQGGHLLETCFHAQAYSLTLACAGRGMHRFMAHVREPCGEAFVLGRLRGNGSISVSRYGAWLFLDYLRHQGLLRAFQSDLAESLALCGLGTGILPLM